MSIEVMRTVRSARAGMHHRQLPPALHRQHLHVTIAPDLRAELRRRAVEADLPEARLVDAALRAAWGLPVPSTTEGPPPQAA